MAREIEWQNEELIRAGDKVEPNIATEIVSHRCRCGLLHHSLCWLITRIKIPRPLGQFFSIAIRNNDLFTLEPRSVVLRCERMPERTFFRCCAQVPSAGQDRCDANRRVFVWVALRAEDKAGRRAVARK